MTLFDPHHGADDIALTAHVTKITKASSDTHIIHISPSEPISYKAGQYIPVAWSDAHEPRYYSIACAPTPDHIEIHVKRGAGKVSQYALDELREGDQVLLGNAAGLNIYDAGNLRGKPVLMIAGGIGFTPHKAMIEAALLKNHDDPLHFYWGTKTAADQYIADYFTDLSHKHDNFTFTPIVGGTMMDEVLEKHHIESDTEIFLAGSPDMLNDAIMKLLRKDIALSRIHFDNHPDINIPDING
jgi:ferredoxin-NADP reductase